jgi:transcriptional regulator GlxA family with amidase domain
VRRVLFVVYPGFTALDLVGPHEVMAAAGAYDVVIAAHAAGPVRSARGPSIVADHSLVSVRGPIDTLIVVGGEGSREAAHDADLVAWVGRAAKRSRRVGSVCTGAFVLAAAGLLEGKRATTHWRACAALARRYPGIEVDPDPIFVRDGDTWTSAGVTAGIDLALALVADDLGREVAMQIARQFVVFAQRPGGQSQFSAQLQHQASEREPIRELCHFVAEHPDADLAVERLAARVAMSLRNFARVFRAETGVTPAAYVESVRVETARRLLETTTRSIEKIAADAGFGTVDTMRRAFIRRVGVTPTSYREHFHTVSEPAHAS